MANTYLAADFGGGSGRIIAGTIVDGKLRLDEIHRFTNRQIKLGKYLYWDFLYLFEEMKIGFRLAAHKGYSIKGVGIDTWGVDFGLIDTNGNLLGNPVCYRDSRTDNMPDEIFRLIDKDAHYSKCGIQVMPINTLFQLYNLLKSGDSQLKAADRLLFMPDLFSYFLTGVANNEYCIASTSELLDVQTRSWDKALLAQLGLPGNILGDIVMPGTIRGSLLPEVAFDTGLSKDTKVIAVGSHDTASAVVAVPSTEEHTAFLSSGTWSLFGTVTKQPILTDKAHRYGFTNEGGVDGTIRFLQNITGLWILQQLMSEWQTNSDGISFDEIILQANQSFIEAFIDVDDPVFLHPASMEKAIVAYCRERKEEIPSTKGQFVRCVLQSLAMRYKKAVDQLNECLSSPIQRLHIIGGGSRNKLLNQLTADYLGIPVYAGPVEATAIGNILVQAWALDEISSMEELKEIAINSAELKIYYPK